MPWASYEGIEIESVEVDLKCRRLSFCCGGGGERMSGSRARAKVRSGLEGEEESPESNWRRDLSVSEVADGAVDGRLGCRGRSAVKEEERGEAGDRADIGGVREVQLPEADGRR